MQGRVGKAVSEHCWLWKSGSADFETSPPISLKTNQLLSPSQSKRTWSKIIGTPSCTQLTWHTGFLLADAICRFVAVRKSIKQYISIAHSVFTKAPVPREIPNCLRSWEILCRKWVVLTWRKVREGVGVSWGGRRGAGTSWDLPRLQEVVHVRPATMNQWHHLWYQIISLEKVSSKCDKNVVSTYHCGHYLLLVKVMHALQPYLFEAAVPKTK